jgi:hypothetical protein
MLGTVGELNIKELIENHDLLRAFKFPSSTGKLPVKKFSFTRSSVKTERFPNSAGMLPFSRFSLKSKTSVILKENIQFQKPNQNNSAEEEYAINT